MRSEQGGRHVSAALEVRDLETDLLNGGRRMKSLPRRPDAPSTRPAPLKLLLADDDTGLRALVAARARDLVDPLVVLEAGDGAEALQIGLQQQPQLALLDVNMPRLDGVDVAITLRELQPQVRLALLTGETAAYRQRAHDLGLVLFDKLHIDQALAWLALHARRAPGEKLAFACRTCGYGVARSAPPDRCPMCHGTDTWIPTPLRRRRMHLLGVAADEPESRFADP
jgi:CheY-like chemotaxis protein